MNRRSFPAGGTVLGAATTAGRLGAATTAGRLETLGVDGCDGECAYRGHQRDERRTVADLERVRHA